MKSFVILSLFFSFLFSFDKVTTFNSDFIQTINNPSGQKIEYSGTIYINGNSKIAWFYKTPMSKEIYILDNEVTIIEPDLEQVIVTKHNIQLDLFAILSQALEKKKNFSYKIDKQTFEIEVDKNGKIKVISYLDEFENKVQISFNNTLYNNKIEDKVYEFVIPYNYDIMYK